MRKALITFLILVTIIIAAKKPKMAVYGFKSETFTRPQIVSLNSILESALIDLGYFKVLTREDIKIILKERELSDIGLVEPEEFGRMVGARCVVFGKVERSFGRSGYATVSVKIIDIDSGEIVFAEARDVPIQEVADEVKRIVQEIGYGEKGIYKKVVERVERKETAAKKKTSKKSERNFLSIGVYYIYYEDEFYYYQQEMYIPNVKFGVKGKDSAYGASLLLGVFYRKYLGPLFGEVGTIALFVPYVEVGVELGMIDVSLMYLIYPGISLTFSF